MHDAADDDAISMDQQSFRSVSTFDLPSPALSSRDAEKAEKKMSWVWQWAEERVDAAGGTRIYCLVPRCTQKKGWASMRGSTSNIRNHLRSDHKLNEHSKVVRTGQQGQPGAIENALTTQGKRTSAHFSTDALERQVCKILVRHKLPYSFVQSSLVQELLEIAHSAPSKEDLELPSNDTISRRVSELQWTLHNVLNLLRLIFNN